MTKQLDKGQIAEVKELYDGTRASVVELSKLFKVGYHVIEYLVNHDRRKETSKKYSKIWQQKNPERTRVMLKKASIKYYKNNREKIRKRARKYYKNNKEKFKQRYRRYYYSEKGKKTRQEHYLKNQEKIKQRRREYYRKNKEKFLKQQKKNYQYRKRKI